MNRDSPLISVIVPNYNHEKFLRQRLDSIFNQTYVNFEVILLDDCSIDNSREILIQYAQNDKVSHCVFNKINTGNTFVQWNRGIALAKGEFIWIAESDDFCNLNFLEVVSKPLIQNKEVVLSYCQSNKVDINGQIIGNWKTYSDDLDIVQFKNDFLLDGNLFIEKYLIYKNVVPNASAVLLKRENLKICPELIEDKGLKYCGDWVIYFQQIINQQISFIAESINNFRDHSDSVIATASIFESKISIIDIDIDMRKLMMRNLKLITVINSSAIIKKNRKIIKINKYDKGLLLFNSRQRWKAIFILLSIADEFVKRYPFRKRFAKKAKKIFT